MAHAALLEDDDETDDLEDFYKENLSLLKKVSLFSVPSFILKDIAVVIDRTLLYDSQWQDIAYSMGLEDNLLLSKIAATAKTSKELPLYVALSTVLQHDKTFGDIIQILLQNQRKDALLIIKPFVEKLLAKKSTTQVKKYGSEESANNTEDLVLNTSETCNSNDSSTDDELSKKLTDLNIKDKSLQEINTSEVKCDLESMNSKCEYNIMCKSSICIEETKHSKHKEFSAEVSTIIPSAPSASRIIVFLQYTEHEHMIAKQLTTKLREEGVIVKALSDIDYLLLMDSVGALGAILREVDFIVPIVSKKFLEQVFPRIDVQYLESTEAMNNRCLYQLFTNEFRNNKCINFRVRPVLVPEMDRELIKHDLILSSSLRLWNEVPKLVNILRKTKELIARYPLR